MSKRIRGSKPTIKQAMVLQQNGIDHRDFLIKRNMKDHLECIHRHTGAIKKADFKTAAVE